MTNPDTDLSSTEREVLASLGNKRANTELIAEQTELSVEEIQTTLESLESAGIVEKITTDLYEKKSKSDDTIRETSRGIPDPNPDTQTAPIDPTEVESDEDK